MPDCSWQAHDGVHARDARGYDDAHDARDARDRDDPRENAPHETVDRGQHADVDGDQNDGMA